jgi:DNA-binding LytR/AlgR family response regulator
MTNGGLTILAVDDERTQLDDLARLLRSSPAVDDVECAYDGREALVKAADGRYDAIFLDVRMPELDGIELGRVLRRFATPPQLVFVSAYDSAAVDAFELRAVDYLRKPVSRRRVEEALDRVTTTAAEPPAGNGAQRQGSESDVIAVANIRGGGTRLLARSDILYAQAHGDYARIVTAASHDHRAQGTMGALWVRARSPPIRGQPTSRDRGATTARGHRGACLRRRSDDPDRSEARRGAKTPPACLSA